MSMVKLKHLQQCEALLKDGNRCNAYPAKYVRSNPVTGGLALVCEVHKVEPLPDSELYARLVTAWNEMCGAMRRQGLEIFSRQSDPLTDEPLWEWELKRSGLIVSGGGVLYPTEAAAFEAAFEVVLGMIRGGGKEGA